MAWEEWECVASIAVEDSYGSFNLEKAVCSHGLFMMAPNLWDPSANALLRPLRLSDSLSVIVRISSSLDRLLRVHVLNPPPRPLSPQDRRFLQAQVERMLRLSDADERNVKEFHLIHPEAKARGFGRVFRCPTLFEDMVKCILLCNCQWPRTLSMAKALCQFQLDLKSGEDFHPTTPAAPREPSRRRRSRTKLNDKTPVINLATKFPPPQDTDLPSETQGSSADQRLTGSDHHTSDSLHSIGDFPTPEELARVDANVLAKRCNLGYRAARIVKLAQSITGGGLQLRQLEQDALLHDGPDPPSLVYDKLAKQLMQIDGFGPFTCANVLVCMGFYQVVPIDSETIRHMNTVHALSCTTKTAQNDVDKVYGKYAPFQFLAFWSELWEFYENWFGKTSKMPSSSYQLITASNMKAKHMKKRIRTPHI